MNGTNGSMAEPMDTSVPSEQESTPGMKQLTSASIANGIDCENRNENNEDNSENDPKEYKNSNTNEKCCNSIEANSSEPDPLEGSQDNVTTNAIDESVNPQDSKPDDKDNSLQDSTIENSEEKESQGFKDEPIDKKQLCNEINHTNKDEHCLENSQDHTTSNKNACNSEENSKNGLESNHSEESNGSDEDTGEDTMSSGDIEKETKNSDRINLDVGDSKKETFKIITIDQHHSDDEVRSINLSDYSCSEGELKAEDTVSIDSDSGEDHNEGGELNKSNESVILIETDTDCRNGTSKTLEVHEIVSDNDDCVLTVEGSSTKKLDSIKKKKPKGIPINKSGDCNLELRRSSRTVKRKKYDDDIQPLDEESDIEEVLLEDPLRRKSKHLHTNIYVEQVTKQGKININQKKPTNIVFIDSPAPVKNRLPTENKTGTFNLNQNLYQTISARGTSVTPISVKATSTQVTQACQTPVQTSIQPPSQPILPTLTDDMFVVEAPSFIVPYVYEKPAKVPFKEFVDKWGKELEEEKAKEEQLLLDKKKEEKAKRDQEKKEKRERGEEVEESEEEVESLEVKKRKAEKAEKRERRRRKKEDDDVSWDGSSSEESEDDSISDDDGQTTILKDKSDVIEEIKDITEVTTVPATKSESYFDLFLGKFFMNIGLNLVQEYVQTDLLKQQKRKLQREKKGGHDTLDRELSIALLTKNLEMSQKTNASLTFEQKKCEFCSFKTESTLALAHHLETPHMKNNLYSCNNCSFEIRNAHDILFHMERQHGVKAKLERAPAAHQCANCPFEDHGKGKLGRHLIACAKKFKPELNLAPPIEWEHPAKIAKIPRNRHNAASYQMASQFGRHHVDGTGFAKVPIPISNAMPSMPTYRPRNRGVQPRPTLNIPVQMRPSGVLIRPAPPVISNYTTGNGKKALNNPSLSITPLPRQQNPASAQPLHVTNAKGFVICEICDGYIKDLEQLRNHMQWIHKVKIHPKMIYNRPPLNCQKCQFRFFTDQGLERHLLGSHGLVTSSMQEAANKGKDAGRCPVCGRVYQWKLLSHVSRDHNLILKPAHLSYKCTVCTATFGMYRQFESHVYSAHSVVAKKVIDKKTPAAIAKSNANDNAAKQLKINDEITIIPQPVKMVTPNKGK